LAWVPEVNIGSSIFTVARLSTWKYENSAPSRFLRAIGIAKMRSAWAPISSDELSLFWLAAVSSSASGGPSDKK